MEENKMLEVVLKDKNTIELPKQAVQCLGVKEGDKIRVLLTEDAIMLMTPEKFGEFLLKKN